MDSKITVSELLESKYLKDICKVVAGEKGLSKPVSWVHILEIRDIVKDCVNGGELVLTTGMGFTSKEVAVNFLKELISQNVTALCIETSLYYHHIHQELKDLADKHDFVLLEITAISRFVDITKGLNTLILNSESKLYHDADNYEQQLNEQSRIGTLEDGIKYTADYLDVEVAFIPRSYGKNMESILGEQNGKNAEIKEIIVYGKPYGFLLFSSKERELNQFDLLIMGRLAGRLRKDLSKELIKKEEVKLENIKWIRQLLDGDLKEKQAESKLNEIGITGNFRLFFVVSIKVPEKDELTLDNSDNNMVSNLDEFKIHTSLQVRRAFETFGFSVFGHMEKQIISYIVFSQQNDNENNDRIKKAITKLKTFEDPYIDYNDIAFAIGKKGTSVSDIKRSYQTSIKLLNDSKKANGELLFYDDLNIMRIVNGIDIEELEIYINDYLKDLLNPENSELLHTLKTYYECNCSKQLAAEKLFIARQTLYFRLEKIENILGYDINDYENKLAVEFALKAHELNQNK